MSSMDKSLAWQKNLLNMQDMYNMFNMFHVFVDGAHQEEQSNPDGLPSFPKLVYTYPNKDTSWSFLIYAWQDKTWDNLCGTWEILEIREIRKIEIWWEYLKNNPQIKSQNPYWSLRPPHRLSAALPAAEHPKSPLVSTCTGEMETWSGQMTRFIRQQESRIRSRIRSRIINASRCQESDSTDKGWTRSVQGKALELFSQFTAKKSFTKKRQVSAVRSEQIQQYIS